MFYQSKYSIWYYSIVENAKSIRKLKGYTEKHHIIPKSLGGSDRQDNMVELTLREHFICHLLLTKMTSGEDKLKMDRALWLMCANKKLHKSSKLYETARENFRKACSGPKNWTEEGLEALRKSGSMKVGEKNGFFNKTHTDEAKEKNRQAHLGKKHKEESKEKLRGENSPKFQGYYYTPWGKFPSSSQAEDAHSYLKSNTINTWCKEPDKKIIRIGKSKFLKEIGETCVGKTYREIGFWFEPKLPLEQQ